ISDMGHRLFTPYESLATLAFLASASMFFMAGCGSEDDGQDQAASSSTPQEVGTSDARAQAKRLADRTQNVGIRQIDIPEQTTIDELPPLQAEPRLLDFGFIPPSTDVTGSVKLINTSEKPLKILAVQPTCKCTTLTDLAGREIPPGGSVELEAVLEGGPNPGSKTASVKVLIADYPRPMEVDLKAEISLPIRMVPPHINAVRGQNPTGRIVIESLTGKPFSICSVHGQKPTLMNFNPETDEPRNKYILSYDLARIPTPFPRYLMITTDDPDAPVVDLYLRHESTMPKINRNLRVSGGYRHPFGRVNKGGDIEMEIGFVDIVDPIATAVSNSPDVRVDIMGQRVEKTPDGEVTYQKLKVTPAKDFTGVLYVPITFMTARGQSVDVPIFGTVYPEGVPCIPATGSGSTGEAATVPTASQAG
ncbi:MAG: DUF1573 domain-containing protein, partial [Phycisphaerales bacterium]|nr:DUF1573 domain-containing protein [Phycisphaerales bacterium]